MAGFRRMSFPRMLLVAVTSSGSESQRPVLESLTESCTAENPWICDLKKKSVYIDLCGQKLKENKRA